MPKVLIIRINGAALREIRQAKQISLNSLADKVLVTRSYLNKIEIGSRQGLNPDLFERLVEALELIDPTGRAILADPYDVEAVA